VKIHHPSDVVAGALVGIVLARVARKLWPLPSVPSAWSGDEIGESESPLARTQAEGLHQRIRGRGR
jgi:hypothetical protein